MIDRTEKLWLIRQQIAKSIAEIDHGDTAASCLALANGLGAMLAFLEATHQCIEAAGKELYAQRDAIASLSVKEPESTAAGQDVRQALDTLRAESSKTKRR